MNVPQKKKKKKKSMSHWNFAMFHEIKFTHTNKISHMRHEYFHTSPQHKFFTMSMPTKSKAKIHPTTSQITNIVKIPWATNIVQITQWLKNTTLQKCSKAKITTWSIIQCLKFQQDHITKWQCLNIKISMKHGNNIFTNKETKEKLTFKSMWECGAWVLGSWRSPSSSFHSNDGWYFFPWEVRKEGPLEEDDILVQRKDGFENGFHKNGCVAKVVKNTRI